MGMYTELILGAKLSHDTPRVCIEALDWVINQEKSSDDEPSSKDVKRFIDQYSLRSLFWCSSYYFGVSRANSAFWRDPIDHCYHISTRSNTKNYEGNIDKFLKYLEPYIEKGSGGSDIYAFKIHEEDAVPTIYALHPAETTEEQ